MAVIAITNGTAHVGGHDFTTDVNQMTLEATVAELDVSTMGSSWRKIIAGQKSSSLALAGFWQAGDDSVDKEAFTNIGVADQVVTICTTDTEGSVAYLTQATTINYSFLGAFGEAAPFSLTASGANVQGVVRGALVAESQAVSSTGGLGSGTLVGAVGSDEYLYAALHVFDAGTTITVELESDATGAFAGSETTRGTFTGITAVGGTWLTRVAGPFTDTYWRANVTTVTGSFTIAVALGAAA
jgi:hypothetical protein